MSYLFIGDHAETLASGRRVGPGESVPASAVDASDPVDERLIAERLLLDVKTKEKESSE